MTENPIEAYLKTKSECDTLETQIRTAIGELSRVIERLDVEKGEWKRLGFCGISYPVERLLSRNSVDLSRLPTIQDVAELTARWHVLCCRAAKQWNRIPSSLRSNVSDPPM